MKGRYSAFLSGLLVLGLAVSCARKSSPDIALKTYALDSLDGVIQAGGAEIDGMVKKEGAASLKITVKEPAVISIFETGDIDVENAALVYQAKVRTQDAQGGVYLEMCCHFEGKGEFFSRGPQSPMTGTLGWTSLETSRLLRAGENPDNVKLNIVSEGTGTIWVDDIRLLNRKLPE
jgi:hypothetical protein